MLTPRATPPTDPVDVVELAPQVPRPPLVLVVDDQEWSARALESVLHPNGFAVLRSPSAQHALELVRSVSPDLVLLGADLPDGAGAALCRVLRDTPGVGQTTPILLTHPGAVRREERMEAVRAGAWDLVSLPLDAEELLLRMGVFVRAKLEADRARAESMVEPATGMYSVHGLLRRVRELGLQAMRSPMAVACAVLAPDEPPRAPGAEREDGGERTGTVARMVELVTRRGRRSDVIGRLSETEFAVVAPNTGTGGVLLLAKRLLACACEDEGEDRSPLRLRVGCYAVDDLGDAAADPVELLVRATVALRRAQRGSGAPDVCFFAPEATAG